MTQISVVIITRNEEHNIKACIRSARQLTDDVVVVDCGSDDRTVAMAKEEGARTCTTDWLGFGYSRNLGASEANHDWILALDADERITPQLALAIKNTAFDDKATVYKFNRRNCIGDKQVRFGTLGFERVRRIYHRHNAHGT